MIKSFTWFVLARVRNIEIFVSTLLFFLDLFSLSITHIHARVCTARGEQEKLLKWVAYIIGYLMKVDLPDSPVPRNIRNEKNNQCRVHCFSKNNIRVWFCSKKSISILFPWSYCCSVLPFWSQGIRQEKPVCRTKGNVVIRYHDTAVECGHKRGAPPPPHMHLYRNSHLNRAQKFNDDISICSHEEIQRNIFNRCSCS